MPTTVMITMVMLAFVDDGGGVDGDEDEEGNGAGGGSISSALSARQDINAGQVQLKAENCMGTAGRKQSF
uniref:Uncharacterized protein n=1 Tax=Arundo donax TaxID=35708 RepID=A0A0A9G7F4_ARUDO